jgi:hypothetical protein
MKLSHEALYIPMALGKYRVPYHKGEIGSLIGALAATKCVHVRLHVVIVCSMRHPPCVDTACSIHIPYTYNRRSQSQWLARLNIAGDIILYDIPQDPSIRRSFELFHQYLEPLKQNGLASIGDPASIESITTTQ